MFARRALRTRQDSRQKQAEVGAYGEKSNSPCTVPKAVPQKREVWDAETIFLALDVCDDARLKLAINLSFACSMRIGEILGLTWDCVDISP